jgi:two-component system phosphate regulon sensor histidine kinase PhoR
LALRRTLLRSLTGILPAVLLLPLVAVPAFLAFELEDRLASAELATLSSGAAIIEQSILAAPPGGDPASVFGGLCATAGFHGALVSEGGAVLADEGLGDLLGDLPTSPWAIAALMGRPVEARLETDAGRILVVARPVVLQGGRGALLLASPRGLAALTGNGWLAVLLAEVASVIAALAALGSRARTLSRAVTELAGTAGRAGRGDFTARAEPTGIIELDFLARSMNDAAARLGSAFGEMERRGSRLQVMLDSAPGPMALFEPGGRIAAANGGFLDFAGVDAVGRDYRECLGRPELSLLVRDSLASGDGRRRIELDGRFWECSWRAAPGDGGTALGMMDVTGAVNLEKVKRDLVLNLSHELRTPLTAIRGYVEALEDHADGRDADHIRIINRNLDRLARLVQDTQDLAQLEEGDPSSVRTTVAIRPILDGVVEMFAHRAAGKGLELRLEGACDFCVEGDPSRLEQVFVNLVDNAVKFTESGGVTIECVGEPVPRVTVRDTGSGIPLEMLPRLCERFFTVDRSRSRALGGTGLGLAIVKHILSGMGARLEIESGPGSGSAFSVVFSAGGS